MNITIQPTLVPHFGARMREAGRGGLLLENHESMLRLLSKREPATAGNKVD